MEWEYLSGIGYIDSENAAIIQENGKLRRLYKCKFVLLLNNLEINGKNEEGKCFYIQIDERDIGFRNDDRCTHVEYLKHTLPKYKFGDGENDIHDFLKKIIEDGEVHLECEDWILPLTKMGICVYVNLCYDMTEPELKQGALYLPNDAKTILDSQIEQIRNLVPVLKKEKFFRTGIFTCEKSGDKVISNLVAKCIPEDLMKAFDEYVNKQQDKDEQPEQLAQPIQSEQPIQPEGDYR